MANNYGDPFGELEDYALSDDGAAGAAAAPMPMPQPNLPDDGGLNALRAHLLRKVAEPVPDVSGATDTLALSAAGMMLARPAHNFWEALNSALYAYDATKIARAQQEEAERIKYAAAADALYRQSLAGARTFMPQAKVVPGVGLVEYNPTTQSSRTLVSMPKYADLYKTIRPQIAKSVDDTIPANYWKDRGGDSGKYAYIEEQTRRSIIGALGYSSQPVQTPFGAPTGITPQTAIPQGSGPAESAGGVNYSERFGVPEDLLRSVERVESGGKQFAVSPKLAMGPMQFHPQTYAALREKGWDFDVFNPEQSRWAAARHLSELHGKYKDWNKALAAYNAGEGAVDSGRAANFPETQRYVPNVMRGAGITPPTPTAKSTPGVAQAGPPIQTPRELEGEKEAGRLEPQMLYKEYENNNNVEKTNQDVESQLLQLRRLYESDENVTSGKWAELAHGIKSVAGTLGMPMDWNTSASKEDQVNAIAINMALHMRTAGGTNLLPGQMSNYEDQMLRETVPSLTLTKQGRLDLIAYMMEFSRSQQRIAREMRAYYRNNGNKLDMGWYDRKSRVVLEEQVRREAKLDAMLRRNNLYKEK